MNKYIFTLLCLFIFLTNVEGQCVSGDCEMGIGIMKYESGAVYIGEWWNGEMNGEGTLIWGWSIYTGQFKWYVSWKWYLSINVSIRRYDSLYRRLL